MSIEKDIVKARKRPMDAAKMKDLLTKIRKGATSTLSFGKLVQVLDVLGWKVEPVLGWTPMHYMYQGKETRPVIDTLRMPLPQLEKNRAAMLSVAEPDGIEEPSGPPRAVNEIAVSEVEEIKKGGWDPTNPIWYFHYRQWVGTEGVTVTSPRGEERTFLPDQHRVKENKTNLADDWSAPHDILRGLKDTGFIDDVNAALGMEAHVPAEARTRENTGTCPACWGNYKLSKGRLVLHGYERPGHGYISGQCFCVGMPPLETSDIGARKFREMLISLHTQTQGELAKLESGEVTAIEGRQGKVFKKGEPHFDRLLEDAIHRAKRTLEQVGRDLELYQKVLAVWHERPMPKEGELQRGPGFFTKK